MYKQLFLTLVLLIFCTPSWSETLTMDDLVKRNNLYYKKFSNVPVTGEISGIESGSFKKGKKYGDWFFYYKNGQLKEKRTYKNGKSEDSFSEYYRKNGQLESKGNVKDGRKDGLWKRYYKNGQLREKTNYKNDYPNSYGVNEYYYENGQLESKGNVKDGMMDGLWKTYYKNGQLKLKENYKDGRKDGLQKNFNKDGSLKKTETYIDGVIQK